MINENSLMEKLLASKKIMDIHNGTPRGQARNISMPEVENFDIPEAKYNIPPDLLMSEQAVVQQKSTPSGPPTKDRIMSSKLPDEIKRLMIEHPIAQPAGVGGTTVISDELVNKAARLMKENIFSEDTVETKKQPQRQSQGQNVSGNVSGNADIKKMVKEAVREILSESGLLVESTSKANDTFSFRVGQHIFEGKISKIKKLK